MAGGRTLTVYLTADTKKAQGALSSFGDKLEKIGKFAGVAAVAGLALLAKKMADVAVEAVDLAGDFEEATSKATVLFGNKAVKDVQKWAAAAAGALGQSKLEATNAASSFAVFGKSAGLTGRDLSGFAIELGTLASDLASFNNTDVDTAITAIGAALRGESEPIRQFGVLLDDATLKARAMKLGLIDTTDNALTPQQKVLAAQAEILAQTSDAQGDFARTADGAANSQKILAAEVENLKLQLGDVLLPVKKKVLQFLIEEFIPRLKELAEEWLPVLREAFDKVAAWWEEYGKKEFEKFTKWWDKEGAGILLAMRESAANTASTWESFTGVVKQLNQMLNGSGESSTVGSVIKVLFWMAKLQDDLRNFALRAVFDTLERWLGYLENINNTINNIIDGIRDLASTFNNVAGIDLDGFDIGGGDLGPRSAGAKGSSTTINIQTGVGDPVAIGREIDRILRLRDLRVGVA